MERVERAREWCESGERECGRVWERELGRVGESVLERVCVHVSVGRGAWALCCVRVCSGRVVSCVCVCVCVCECVSV